VVFFFLQRAASWCAKPWFIGFVTLFSPLNFFKGIETPGPSCTSYS
jgi:hypothetical protein